MSFIATGPAAPAMADVIIENHSFFPAIKLSEFRTAMKIDSVVTAERAEHALKAAVIEVNSRLSRWMVGHMSIGIAHLDDVPLPAAAIPGQNQYHYLRAVWSLAKGNLVERYRDFDSTKSGHERADTLEITADDYRRDASWAINDLTGIPRSTVELI